MSSGFFDDMARKTIIEKIEEFIGQPTLIKAVHDSLVKYAKCLSNFSYVTESDGSIRVSFTYKKEK